MTIFRIILIIILSSWVYFPIGAFIATKSKHKDDDAMLVLIIFFWPIFLLAPILCFPIFIFSKLFGGDNNV